MSKRSENIAFDSAACGDHVLPLDNGSYRNHCPHCLCSVHVDVIPGDRASDCLGVMRPVDVAYHSAKGFQIVHECAKCGHRQRNKVAVDCTQPDDLELIRQIQSANAPWN